MKLDPLTISVYFISLRVLFYKEEEEEEEEASTRTCGVLNNNVNIIKKASIFFEAF